MITLLELTVIASASLFAQVPLFPNPRLDTGRAPTFVAAADLDQDSHLDAVATNPLTGDATVLLGDGAGGFTVAGHFACGAGPLGAVLSDFNGDGKIDAAVPGTTAMTLALLLGDGAGGFAAPQILALGQGFGSFAGGDIDLDGDVDIVLGRGLGAFNSLISLRSNGAGGFTVQNSPTVAGIHAFALVDLTGDGKLDVVCANEAMPLTITTYTGNGAGGFAHLATIPHNAKYATALAGGDLDGDGDADVAIEYVPNFGGSSGVSVLTNNGQGALSILSYINLPISGPRTLSIGDLDDDGEFDLVAHGAIDAWLRGSGGATFAQPKVLPAAGSGCIADFDHDGRNDLLTAIDIPVPSVGLARKDAFGRFSGAPQSAFGGGIGHAILDFDQDGDPDLVSFPGPMFGTLGFSRNDGYGNFLDLPAIPTPPLSSSTVRGPRVGDFDADGRDDVLLWYGAEGGPLHVGLGNGAGGFSSWKSTVLTGGTNVWHFSGEIGDFNQDGFLDFADGKQSGTTPGPVTVEIRPGAGDGSFLPVATSLAFGNTSWSNETRPFTIDDMDVDGRADIVIADSTGFGSTVPLSISIARGIGPFQFAAMNSISAGVGLASRVATGDIDNDGAPDVAIVSGSNNVSKISLLHGDGLGGGAVGLTLTSDSLVEYYSGIAIADFDADGSDDLIVSRPGAFRISWLRSLGPGFFDFAPAQASQVGVFGLETIPADLDGDGRLDVTSATSIALMQLPPVAPCAGGFAEYGTGCHGDSWFVPHLQGFGCPTPGGVISITLDKAPGLPTGSVALLFGGVQSTPLPLGYGCSLLVFPIVVGPLAVPLTGFAPGGGGFSIFTELPPSTLTGVSLSLQAFAPHTTVASGYSNSNGLRIDVQ